MDESPFFNPFDLNFKNLANTCVLHWGDKLYALWEVCHPSPMPYGSHFHNLGLSKAHMVSKLQDGLLFARVQELKPLKK